MSKLFGFSGKLLTISFVSFKVHVFKLNMFVGLFHFFFFFLRLFS